MFIFCHGQRFKTKLKFFSESRKLPACLSTIHLITCMVPVQLYWCSSHGHYKYHGSLTLITETSFFFHPLERKVLVPLPLWYRTERYMCEIEIQHVLNVQLKLRIRKLKFLIRTIFSSTIFQRLITTTCVCIVALFYI